MHRYAVVAALALPLFSQTARLHPAPEVPIPFLVDGNSPSVWINDHLVFFTSDSHPVVAAGSDVFHLSAPRPVLVDTDAHVPMWIEAAWRDTDGAIYGWYHNEPRNVCPGSNLSAPRIGAIVSYDDGNTFTDLGLILTSGDPVDCNAKNGFFAGGHGDFSVILDRSGDYFYFLFTSYGGSVEGQGIGVARMAFADRANPSGAVLKYHRGEWTEPGLGGKLTPVFRARTAWQRADADSFWGPAVHWNTFLERYVVLMNRTCCEPGWPQQGIHVTFNADLSHPEGWTTPEAIIGHTGYNASYYPQVMGLEPGGTDTVAGQVARLYVHGWSRWLISFIRPEDAPQPEPEPESGGSEQP